ncbi:MAG: GGDEF domain-containing protein [Pseudomonadota bacterium]
MFTIIPKDDPKQALRLRRFFLAFLSYLVWTGLVGLCALYGYFRLTLWMTMLIIGLPMLAANVGIYTALRSGYNKRFSDPSLTMFQIGVATLVTMITVYFVDQVRGMLLMVYLVTFVFGIFRLRVGQFLVLTGFALVSYSVAMGLLHLQHPQSVNLRMETLQILSLATVLVWFSVVASYIRDLRLRVVKANAELTGALATIEKLAVQDPLTGVYNRRRLMDVLRQEKGRVDRGGPAFSVCILDLDHFKEVNDRLGHLAGDEVLKAVAEKLVKSARNVDCVARWGGEEFVALLPQTELAQAMVFASRIREEAAELRFPGLPGDFGVTVSVGVATYAPGEPLDDLITRADNAMYRAKHLGRNRIESEPPPAPPS